MVSQTERAIGTVGFSDPAVIDPTTSKPYTPEASMRQQQKLDRPKLNLDSSLKETVKKVMEEEPDLTETEPSKDLPSEQEGFLKPRARPENIKPIRQSPINKILELGYLIRGESNPRSKTTETISNFSSDNPDAIKALKGWMDSAVGGKSGLDPVKDAWCATFITHILSELGADPLKAKDTFARVRADAYRKYGTPVAPEDIKEGDLVIFDWNKDGKADHVTFYAGDRITSQDGSNYINVVGGNQWAYNAQGKEIKEVSLRENYGNYTWDKVMDVRRITYNDINYEFTEELANQDPAFLKFLESTPKKGYEKGGLSAQTEEAFKQPKKGLSYGELIIDNILGLDNEYESFGEKLGKAIDEDEINFLKNAAVGVYEGAKEFVTSPVETTKKVVTDIKDSVQRLGTENLNTRLKNMYGISYNEATDEQVNKAKEAVFADALTALDLIPATNRIIKALDAPEPKPESEIIAGPGATGYYDSNYDRAKELEEKGYSPAQIEQMTGRFQTGKSSDYVGDIPENPFKFEIDDSRVEIKGSDGFQTLKESTRHSPIAVGHIIPTHTELFKEYPNLRNVAFYIDPKKTGSGAHFDPSVGSQGAIVFSPNNKSLTSPNKKGFRNTFFHELQHAAQFQDYKIAGLKQLGGNPVFLGKVGTVDYLAYKPEKDILEQNKNFVKLRDEILDIFEKQRGTGALDQTSTGAILPGQVPNPGEVFGDVAVAKNIARKMRELESELFKTYMKTVSEVESRVVGKRAAEIATVGSGPKPRVAYDLATERKIETLKEFQSDKPKSFMGKKVEDFKLKLGPMTDEEILRYAVGGINFARYAKGIDKDLQGFDLFGPTKPNYAEGGTVMNRQMEMAFMREGGLKDDGMNVDPVSGNEVPPGSMAKEVRDDIPARLSEGEYVVPADVVQYYGVKFFEDLRADAKIGLQEMERNGRIGGEPVDDDLSDEEMMEIQTMMQGGMVQPQQQSDPYLQQNMMYQQPQGMAVGGAVIPNIGTGFSWEATGPGSITPTVPGTGETPETCAARGMVYNPETKMCEMPAPVTTPVVTDTGGDRRPEAPTPEPWYKGITSSAEDSVNRYFGMGAKIGAGVVGFMASATPLGILGGGAAKYGVQGSNLAKARAEVALRTAAGDIEGAEMLQKAIDKAIKGTVGLEKADQFFENTFNASGERNVISALEGIGITVPDSIKSKDFRKDSNFDSDLMDFIQSQGSKIRTDIFKMEAKPTPKTKTEKAAPSVSLRPKARPTDLSKTVGYQSKESKEALEKVTAKTQKTQTAKSKIKEAAKKDPSAGIYTGGGPSGGFNKGGLMKKKKK